MDEKAVVFNRNFTGEQGIAPFRIFPAGDSGVVRYAFNSGGDKLLLPGKSTALIAEWERNSPLPCPGTVYFHERHEKIYLILYLLYEVDRSKPIAFSEKSGPSGCMKELVIPIS